MAMLSESASAKLEASRAKVRGGIDSEDTHIGQYDKILVVYRLLPICNILMIKVLVIGNMYRYLRKRLSVTQTAILVLCSAHFKGEFRHKNQPPGAFDFRPLFLISLSEIHHTFCRRFSDFHVGSFEALQKRVF